MEKNKYENYKEECRKCNDKFRKLEKGYCIGTMKNEKGLICLKKISNGSKYRQILRSKKQC